MISVSPCIDHSPALSFEVWGDDDYFGMPVTRLFAAFRYLLEALDYVKYCGKSGHSAILRGLNTRTVNVTVYAADKAATLATGHDPYKAN